MVRKIDWDKQIGRRFRLRDLHVFVAVAQRGNMGKAATQLGVSQPTVSETVADLEHALGVRLFDRSRQGVELTIYGDALLSRARTAFDELRQGVRDIEFLSDSTSGELRIGCPESIASVLISPVVQQFVQKYPNVSISMFSLNTPTFDLPLLRDRTLDLAIVRSPMPLAVGSQGEHLLVECLFDDPLVVVCGIRNRWARRRNVDLADLIDEPSILTPPGAAIYNHVMEAFRVRGLAAPSVIIGTQLAGLRGDLIASGRYIAPLPRSIFNLYAKQFPLKLLPVDLPIRPWPIALVTLKNRTLGPLVARFIECMRQVAKSVANDGRRVRS